MVQTRVVESRLVLLQRLTLPMVPPLCLYSWPTWASHLAPNCPLVLVPRGCTCTNKGVKGTGSQSIHISFLTTRLRFPQQAFCLTSALSRQHRSSCPFVLVTLSRSTHEPAPFLTSEPVRKKTSYLITQCLLLTASALCVRQDRGTMVSFSFAMICQGQD